MYRHTGMSYTHIHTHIHTYIHTYIHTHIHTYIHAQNVGSSPSVTAVRSSLELKFAYIHTHTCKK